MEQTNCNLCGSDDTQLLYKVKERLLGEDTFNIVQCKQCALIYTNPRPTRDEINKYYPETYSTFYFSHPDLLFPEENNYLRKIKNKLKRKILQVHYGCFPGKEIPSLKRNLFKILTLPLRYQIGWIFPPYRKNGKILDVGCSTGHYLAKLREIDWETYGVELSPVASSWARNELGLNVFTGTLEKARFPSEYFDVITLWHTVEHLPDPCGTLREIYKVLKKEGFLLMGVPNCSSIEVKIFGKWWWAWEVPRHLYHFSPYSIEKIFLRTGFKLIKIEYPPNVHNIMLSLQNIFLNRFFKRENWTRKFFEPAENPELCFLLMPLGYFLSFTKQVGRIVVYGQK